MSNDEGRYNLYNTNVTSYMIDIPPLEDCSELFKTPIPKQSISPPSLHCSSTVQASKLVAKGDEGFAGMKKGFLNRGKVGKKQASDDMPFIRPSKQSDTSNLRIPEVQEALKTPLLGSNGKEKQ